jgi:hypothetical protein
MDDEKIYNPFICCNPEFGGLGCACDFGSSWRTGRAWRQGDTTEDFVEDTNGNRFSSQFWLAGLFLPVILIQTAVFN